MARMAYWPLFIFLAFFFHVAISIEDDVKASLINFLSELTQANGIIDPNFGWNMSSDPCGGQWKGITCNNQSTAVKKIILDDLNLSGSLNAGSLCSAQFITVLSLNNNRVSGRIPQEIGNCKQLTHFYASGNKLSGSLPDSFSSLNNLKRLVISNNQLSGALPNLPRISGLVTFITEFNQFTGEIPKFDFSNLQDFNVSFNNFSGPIPSLGLFSTSSILGNPGLCGEPLSNACPPRIRKKSKHVSIEKVLMYTAYALILLLFVIFVAYRVIKRNARKKVVKKRVYVDGSSSTKPSKGVSSDTSRSEYSITSAEGGMNSSSLVVLTSPVSQDLRFEDLLRAPAELLGRGKHGSLYKVTMENHTILAVKRIKEWDISKDDFKKRLEKIDKVKHPNVLPAVAFYCSKEEKLLVYEYQENGSLFKLLYGSQNGKTFDWNTRLNVASRIADALAYMHENLSKDGIPHGNIKSSNILFDSNMESCVSEYGLLLVDNQDSFSLASKTGDNTDERKNSLSPSFKIDVYGFGVVLLELLTGKLVQNNGSELARWVHSVVQEEWTVEVFDKALVVEGASDERMVNLLQVALKCINPSPEARPTMSEVALIINTIKEEDEMSTGSDP